MTELSRLEGISGIIAHSQCFNQFKLEASHALKSSISVTIRRPVRVKHELIVKLVHHQLTRFTRSRLVAIPKPVSFNVEMLGCSLATNRLVVAYTQLVRWWQGTNELVYNNAMSGRAAHKQVAQLIVWQLWCNMPVGELPPTGKLKVQHVRA